MYKIKYIMFIMYIVFLDYHNCVKGHITSDRKEKMTFELYGLGVVP